MADKTTIYRPTLHLSDSDRGVYETLQPTLALHPSETHLRLVARLLAFALCYQEGISFTKGICDGDSPDIWVKSLDDRLLQWIEVGLPTVERMEQASRKAEQVTLFIYGNDRVWREKLLPQMQRYTNLTIHALPQDLLQPLTANLERKFEWHLTRVEGVLYLDTGNAQLEAVIETITTQ
ncbi:MAG: YaeQ family protein [Gammaproteobacteria bacterium]|nr:YaeQ family protein [Gammaproteobacteria bacterium]